MAVLLVAPISHDDGAARGKHAPDTMTHGDLHVLDLRGSGATHLTHRLLQREHAVHPSVRVAQPAAVGVERQLAAWRCIALRDESRAFAAPDETEIFESIDGQMSERIVDHQVI